MVSLHTTPTDLSVTPKLDFNRSRDAERTVVRVRKLGHGRLEPNRDSGVKRNAVEFDVTPQFPHSCSGDQRHQGHIWPRLVPVHSKRAAEGGECWSVVAMQIRVFAITPQDLSSRLSKELSLVTEVRKRHASIHQNRKGKVHRCDDARDQENLGKPLSATADSVIYTHGEKLGHPPRAKAASAANTTHEKGAQCPRERGRRQT